MCQLAYGWVLVGAISLRVPAGFWLVVLQDVGTTPLHRACHKGHDVVVRALLASGAAVNQLKPVRVLLRVYVDRICGYLMDAILLTLTEVVCGGTLVFSVRCCRMMAPHLCTSQVGTATTQW